VPPSSAERAGLDSERQQHYVSTKVARKKVVSRQHRWRVGLIKATLQKHLGNVYASDERTAHDEAIREFKVPESLHKKLVLTRED
jgi:hypothetical protein